MSTTSPAPQKGARTLDWKSLETWQNLFAAVIAAHDLKLNYNETARYMSLYGPRATYDSVEGRFRGIRKEAERLRKASADGNLPAATPRRTKDSDAESSSTTKVKSGRVTKAKATTTKPAKTKALKKLEAVVKKEGAIEISDDEEEVDEDTKAKDMDIEEEDGGASFADSGVSPGLELGLDGAVDERDPFDYRGDDEYSYY